MPETETSPRVQTRDGKAFDILHPRAQDVEISTIAIVLSRIPRFAGHTRIEYKVAEHSLHVARSIGENGGGPSLVLAALLHDSHEVYSGFGDVCRPVKDLAPIVKQIEGLIDKAIAAHFGFDFELFYHPDVRLADDRVLAAEMRDVMDKQWSARDELPEPVEWNVWNCYGSDNVSVASIFKKNVEKTMARCDRG